MLKTRFFAIEKLSAAILFSLLVGYLSFIGPPLGGFGEIFPEVMSPREISSLQEIFHRILRAEGL